jgi:PKD repeat protein
MVQSLPKTAWGKKYLTTASAGYQSALPLTPNIYRICVTDPTTLVSVNGIPVAVPLQSNFYYELPATTETQLIEADKPIMVAQYFPSQTACGAAANDGDPEVIYLSPVEQSINSVRWNACRNNSINSGKHYINVIIPNTGTAISSFKLDGVTVPATSFTVFPQDPAFSYIILNVAGSNVPPGVAHAVTSDSGFNAIAYGYGQFESYGYNAGTNIRDLYNFLSPINPYSIALDPVACTGSPFYFSVTFPFQPTSIAWDFHLNPNQSPNANVVQNAPVSDSTYLIGTKRVWRYKLPGLYTYNLANSAPGYTVSISAGTTDPEGCGNTFERDFILAIYDPPVAKMDWFNNGCVTDSVRFRDTTVYLAGTYSYKWYWNFGDGKTDSVRYPVHKYTTPGTYTVKFAMISNVGCFSDTAIKTITVTNVPTVGFTHSTPVCVGSSISFTSNAAASPPGNLQKWFWDFGDGTTQTLVAPASGNITHTYTAWGNQNANLRVETNSGCKSIIDTNVIYVNPIPFVNFNLPGGLCLPSDTARFFDASSIADGSQASFQYLWNFGDPPSGALNTSIIKDPVHYYNSGGPFTIKLQIKSSGGCVKDTTKLLTTVYPRPLSGFTVQSEYCLNAASSFTSSSVGSGSPITNWYWDFGDGTPVVNATLATATHTYTTTGIKTIKHWIKTDKGCISDTTVKTVTINSLPDASFTTNAPYCKGVNITFTNTSVANSGNIVLWNWNLGDATILNLNNGNPLHTHMLHRELKRLL